MKIVIAGPKGAGKSTVGKELSDLTGLPLVETDRMIEQYFEKTCGRKLTCREIYQEFGDQKFRQMEKEVIQNLENANWQIIVCGGSSLIDPHSRQALQKNAVWIFLKAKDQEIWARMERDGLPPWLQDPWAQDQLSQNNAFREALLAPFSDIIVDTTDKQPAAIAQEIADELSRLLAIRQTAANTYGDIIRITTFGESHGPAIGAVFDGVAPGMEISPEDIQAQLNRRRPGQSDVTTPRDEKDQVEILSGVLEGKTTGAPIAMVIFNRDHDSSKYEGIKELFRPGHADYTFYKKYGIRDHRGGGRSSGRETAGRVTCGAIARKWLAQKGVKIIAHSMEIAGIRAQSCDHQAIEKNDVRCADPVAAAKMKEAILAAKDNNDSVGGIVKLEIHGLPAGLGDPVFGKLDARITGAIMTIGAIKGIEVGQGFKLTHLRGSQSNDNMSNGGFVTNNAGGITGGISTGQTVYFQIAVKPTSSIAKPQQTIDLEEQNRTIETHGRHDPCIVPRIIPVIENMTALVLYDCWQIQSRINPDFQ